jgi:hypothetical protein
MTGKEALVIYYLGMCVEGLRKPRKTSVRIVGVSVEIRSNDLPKTSQKGCMLAV